MRCVPGSLGYALCRWVAEVMQSVPGSLMFYSECRGRWGLAVFAGIPGVMQHLPGSLESCSV